ncbi:hypothetical protein G9A89_009602 [Geosiphon pyriformis]|nr:hypothetical protein G9A89_009602 [Geosiphon pyriformis]
MCDTTCQYTILICNWVRGGTPFEAAFNRALKRLQHYSHDEDELYNTTQAKVREGTAKEIQRWKESAKVADKWTNSRTTTNNYAPLNKSKNNTSLKSTLISVKTVSSRAKISAVKSVKTKGT